MSGKETSERRPWVLYGMLGTIIALLLVSITLQAGVLNPATQSTRAEVKEIACAQAESTANAFRFRQVGPNGKLESRDHFLTRMLAQRHTLLIARGSGCKSAPGFPPFEVQVARALREINGILGAGPARRQTAMTDVPGADAPGGGASQQPSDTATQQPGPSGGHGEGQGGGHPAQQNPPPQSPEPSPVAESPASTGDTEPDPAPAKAPVREVVTPVLEGVGDVVCSLPLQLCP